MTSDTRRGNAAALAALLEVELADLAGLSRALVHRSYSFENGGIPTNERLEFLGDAVLSLSVADEIFHSQPDAAEGRLAPIRSAAVRAESLADLARGLELGEFVLLGRGEAASGGADKDSILADTFEAVLGAVYLALGWAATDTLVRRLLAARLVEVTTPGAALDNKTALQELAAAEAGELPSYEVSGTGPDHAMTFTAAVSVGGQVLGRGVGRNKKDAEQQAAEAALSEWDVETLVEKDDTSG